MHFAHPMPWWLALGLVAGVGAVAYMQYRRPLAPLSSVERGLLAGLRVLTLALLVLFLFRPIAILPPTGPRDAIVPILVDTSRSMRIADADNQTRLTRALSMVKSELLPKIAGTFHPELYSVGDALMPLPAASLDRVTANARRTDLSGALTAVRDRYRGQRVAGIVLVSDGGETGSQSAIAAASTAGADGPPVFAVGVGSADGLRDREVLGIAAGDPRIDRASGDLHVSVTSAGYGRTPFELRVSANGRQLDTHRVVPPADGSPVDEVFTVSPDLLNPTVYTADIPTGEGEAVVENNSRSVLVSPAGRRRRVLVVEGAPGFEHSFLTRAWAGDASLEVDAVTRKGRNADGQDTFFVQAGAGRAAALTSGFVSRRDQLFAYDALVLANVEGDFFSRAQLQLIADFVGERGGGLLVMGGRAFAQRGLAGTPLEEVLPVELNDRRGGLVRASMSPAEMAAHNRMTLTADGESHPIMRIGASPDVSRKLWASLPALAASAALGGPRPGAKVLALTTVAGGAMLPVVAVQRYGHGRSMIFAGEASWRWKMMMASSDRAYDVFWRQSARWLAADAPDPVDITLPDAPEPGDVTSIEIETRDASFLPVPDATVDVTLTAPGGAVTPLKLRRADGGGARLAAAFSPDRAGLYRIRASASRAGTALGSPDRWLYVGGADREFADPRLNESVLRRMARATGGQYLRPGELSGLVSALQSSAPQHLTPERRDLWHEPWSFVLIIGLLSAEWILRRRWGLR